MDPHLLLCLVLLAPVRPSAGQSLGCRRGQWLCDDGTCILDVWRCDGEGDCLDGSDEMDCAEPPGSPQCPPGQFACLDSVGCVDASARCDGKRQCPTGSDEENCPAPAGCLDSDWTCGNGLCVPKEQRCNRVNDCVDDSDEKDCGVCVDASVRCPDGTCLSPEERCDGKVRCSDGSDEPITCGRTCSVNNGGCSHACVDEPWGALCACRLGFELSANGAVCEDLDECAAAFSPCMHHCTNTIGSYYCHCRDGFRLTGNSICVATGNATRLLTLQRRSIGLLSVKSQQFEAVVSAVIDPVALAFDVARGWFFWANERGSIFKSDARHSWTTFTGEPGIKSLACDWLNGNLYWTNQRTQAIYMQAADGDSFTTLLRKNIRPSDLVLLPVESLMFWINGVPGERVTIEKSWMDGSERSTLTVLTAQAAHSLTADVEARRLYWISAFKRSIETVKVDGGGLHSFTRLFPKRAPLSLAVFEGFFYWVDDKGLWQIPQNQQNQKKFLWKADLPLLAVFHELQQPQGSSACAKKLCGLCQLTKANPAGFSCSCPDSKMMLLDGSCDYPRFIYATSSNINLLEFREKESSEELLFSTDDGILAFDVDWYRDWLYWANNTGHIQRTSLTQVKTEVVPAPQPVCRLKVDQRKGALYWVSCDQKSISTSEAGGNVLQQLYRTAGNIQDIYLDWMRGCVLWLEDDRIFSLSETGGKAKELLQLAGGVTGGVAFDLRANSLLWTSGSSGLVVLSLLQGRSHQAGRRWNVSGSVVGAFEPFLLSLSDGVMTLWDRRRGTPVQTIAARGPVVQVVSALGDIRTVPSSSLCSAPSVLCRRSSVCLPPARLCDGKQDCPEGDDEELCVSSCPSKEDFKCKDNRNCISRSLVCDGRSNCRDASDEVGCPTVAPPTAPPRALKCRVGWKLCRDGAECVSYGHVCDGEDDCKDGSDEMECDATPTRPAVPSPTAPPAPTVPPCSSPSVLCPSADICISSRQMCDGRKDCPDGFDENTCVKRCPSKTDFRCKDRRSCVPKTQVCDGRAHCHDGSDEVNCPAVATPPPPPRANVLKCRVGSRLCGDGTECVLFTHVCDGERDCRDGSDEQDCENPATVEPSTEPPTKPACTSPSVLCPGSSLCIKPAQMCDGRRDCPDGSDENCVKRCPYMTDFRCKDRRSCVPKTQVCDGRAHCHDGSDEVNCPAVATPPPPPPPRANVLKCRVGSRLCGDGKECVLFTHVCDGERDCRDGSDEQDCVAENSATVEPSTEPPTKPPCTSPSVLCPGSSLCIKAAQMCDGRRDCPDGSDENCLTKCPYTTQILCKDRRRCISKNEVCDGRAHCHDGSDELGCPSESPPESRANVLKCRKGSRPCNDGTECVLYSHVCDGEKDCMDGSDERGCPDACEQDEFRCFHGKMCIPVAQVCDGRSQCRDQSDELDCREQTKSCEYRCPDGKRCIPKKFLCDGERDCVDGADEEGCGDSVTAAPTTARATPSTTKLVCKAPSVLCPGSSTCISQNQLCDARHDCPDGFDETDCVFQCKNREDFLCSDRRKCISKTEVCDGRSHCPDGSDEMRCRSEAPVDPHSKSAPLKCTNGFKLCKDGLDCVMYSHLCDGEADCRDGSDEEGCAVRCKAGEFQCSHGNRCVPPAQVCDGQYNCRDRSDELDCSKMVEGCDRRCDNNTRCIPKTFLCDGERDCADGSDEQKCGLVSCAINQFRCTSGQCVTEAVRCDGYADCSDHSDEMDCARPPRCPGQLRCPHSHECLQKEWLCDGENDCSDGSDEKNCVTPPAKCREYQWQCGDSSQCIPLSWRCDGKSDCHNGADEDKCPRRKCPSPLYQCGSGECVAPGLVCNGLTNCADRSDEGAGCAHNNCSSPLAPRCEHGCTSTPHGASCYCAAGFTLLSSTVSCVDVDECSAEPHAVCKHNCQNSRGSYVCHCHPGFYLEPDNKSCKTKDEPWLLASVQAELLLLGVHSGTLRLLSSANRPVFSLDYHWARQRVYWLSPDYQSIRWTDVNGSNNKGTLIKGVKSDFIAVDWIGKNLYWVDGLFGQILAVKLSDETVRSQDFTVVLGEDLEQPSSLVLLPHKGLMLWSEIGRTPQIERAGMDGSQRKVLVSQGLSWPVGLAFDLLDNRVYWADEKLRCIGSASLDGDQVTFLQLAETPSPFSVGVFNDRLFWSDTKRRTIRSADKNTGKDQKVLLKRPGQPFGLKLMHALSQPATPSPCAHLRCSHLCLLAPAERGQTGAPGAPVVRGLAAVCRCPKGLLLSKDRITCSLPTESTFMLLLSRTTVYQIYLHTLQKEGVALKKMPTSRQLVLPGVTEAVALDASIHGLFMYVSDAGQGTVDVLKMSGPTSRQGLTPAGRILKLKEDSVTALAVDWVTSNLYWSSTNRPDLHVTSQHNGYTTSLLQGSLTGTTSIALHPPSGRLCYTAIVASDEKSRAEVNCAWMDGRNKAVLWRESIIPTSLVFSHQGSVIYWADTGEGLISSVGVDGSGYKQYKTGSGLLVSFTQIENFLLWVTLDKDVTKLWFSDGLQPKQLWFETKTSVVEVKAYGNSTQSGANGCSDNNGGCAHLCLAFPGGGTCKCGEDFYRVGATSCARLHDCPDGERACFDGTRCISISRFCDGRTDCPDQSDEQDCPNTNYFGTPAGDERPETSSPRSHNKYAPKKDSASCDQQRCRGQGRCVKDGDVTRCQCAAGYRGEFCQETAGGSNHGAVVVGVLCLLAALTAAAFIFVKRRGWESIRSRSTEKETLMADMGLPDENDDSEELGSPVDTKNTAFMLKALKPK